MQNIILDGVRPPLKEAFVNDRWFKDEDTNWMLGFGKGPQGIIGVSTAIGDFKNSLDRDGKDGFYILGVYDAGVPVGFITTRDLGQNLKTVELFIFIAPEFRNQGIGSEVLQLVLKKLFESKSVFRVQGSALTINKPGIKFFRSRGFTQEGIRKSAFWMGVNVFDVAPLRILKPDWVKESKPKEVN